MVKKTAKLLSILVLITFLTFLPQNTRIAEASCPADTITATGWTPTQSYVDIEIEGCVTNIGDNLVKVYVLPDRDNAITILNLIPNADGSFSRSYRHSFRGSDTDEVELAFVLFQGTTNTGVAVHLPVTRGTPPQGAPFTGSNPDIDLMGALVLNPSQGSGAKSVGSVFSTPAAIVNLVIPNIMILAGIILFITTLFSGFKFIYQGSKGKEEARTIMTVAVIGFILIFVAYWIVQIISIVTGIQII